MNKSGIYQFKNIITGTIYIGSAKNLIKRKARHILDLKNGKHHSLKFQRSFNKYGIDNFEYSVLKYEIDISKLIILEQHYLNEILFASKNDEVFDIIGLNISRVAQSSYGTKRTAESKLKMSLKAKERYKLKDPWNKGKTGIYSAEALKQMSIAKKDKPIKESHKKKISAFQKGRAKGPQSEEHKEKNRKGHIGRKAKRGVCIYCNKDFGLGIIAQYHNEKCKLKVSSHL